MFREFESIAEADHVRVNDHADVDAERIAQYDVGGLSGYAGQSQQILHRLGHFTIELLDDHRHRAGARLGFVAKDPQ